VLLAATVGRGDSAAKDEAIRQAIEDIELEIGNLRAIIADLRPSMLDDLGLIPAINSLLDRRRDDGLDVVSRISIPGQRSEDSGLTPDLETAIYRVIQEALTNVVKHARASTVRVSVGLSDGHVVAEVEDDGVGFDPASKTAGFGLAGMRERVYLAGGTIDIASTQPGTRITVRLPVGGTTGGMVGSDADRIAW
jgi:signal transduction histidine kinase